jgi:hypothetical protein
MRERFHYDMASGFAELMLMVIETEYQRGERDLDAMMRRLKDLSAYSLTHAEIMDQSEGVELLALGMFFGMTSNSQLRNQNQSRLTLLSGETYDYEGQAEVIVEEVTRRKKGGTQSDKGGDKNPLQPRLL